MRGYVCKRDRFAAYSYSACIQMLQHVCVYVCVCVCMCVHVCACVVCVCMSVCMYAYAYAYVIVLVCVSECVCVKKNEETCHVERHSPFFFFCVY